MAPLRPNSRKTVQPLSSALIELVRLLARQAAREWIKPELEAEQRRAPNPL